MVGNLIKFGLNILVESSVCVFESKELAQIDDVVSNSFHGSGVYGLYYIGDFEPYKHLTGINRPIYIGKAVSPGWRTGDKHLKKSKTLYKRLKEHHKSISCVSNLNTKDFLCRYCKMENDLISAVESKLIRLYRPIFNNIINGIGNHNVGATRGTQIKPLFDEIHPGRPWASSMPGDESRIQQCFDKLDSFAFVPNYERSILAKIIAKLST